MSHGQGELIVSSNISLIAPGDRDFLVVRTPKEFEFELGLGYVSLPSRFDAVEVSTPLFGLAAHDLALVYQLAQSYCLLNTRFQ